MNNRLFVAIDLPEAVKDGLTQLRFSLPPQERWTDKDQLHLTLRFMGEVDGSALREIEKGLALVRQEPFELQLKGVGAFHSTRQTKILWAGVVESEPLKQLKGRVDKELRGLDIEPDDRRFVPHITLARLKNTPLPYAGRFQEQFNLYDSGPFLVQEFHLYSSHKTSKGMHYRKDISYRF